MNSLVRIFFRQWFSRKYNLASYIKIEEGQIFFNLDKQALRKIHQARIRNCPLYIPCSLRILLLRHALLYIGIITPNKKKKANIYLLPGLTFYTCYSDYREDRKLDNIHFVPGIIEKNKLLRSVISLDGDILNQISNSSLQHPYFSEISAAHHWLTTQLLNHLHVTLNLIPLLIWLFFTGVTVTEVLVPQKSIIISLLILMGLWIWWRPLIIKWTLARILSF